jgi:8-oxo-dGTP diphosphatase
VIETLSDLGRCGHFADLDHIDIGLRADLFGLSNEGRFPFLAMAPGEAIRCQPAYRWALAHIYPSPMLSAGEAFHLKKLQCVPDGHSGNAIVVDQLRLGRKPVTLVQAPVLYRRPQVVSDLPEHGPVAGGLHRQAVKHAAHQGTSFLPPTPLVRTSSSLKGTQLADWSNKVVGEDTRHSVSVAGVVIDEDGRALVIQRRDNAHWEPPGGILERDETITDGLRREVKEETGLTVEPVALTGVYKNMSRSIVALVFRCRAVGGTLTENPEVTGFRWVRESDINKIMPEAYAVRILDAYRPSAAPAVRDHDGVRLVAATG